MKQFINPVWPVEEVRSVDQLMDIAVGMEHEAAARYDVLAGEMGRRGEAELAGLFGRMAELERAHEDGLASWARREGRAVPRPASFAWQMPETFGGEADGAEAHTLTPYRALSLAVRNEERAFSFYSYLAAMAESPEIRTRAEALAREELNHVAELRSMRRRAWHEGGTRAQPAPRGVAELQARARAIETASVQLDRRLSEMAAAAGDAGSAAVLTMVADQAEAALAGLPAGDGNAADGATDAVQAARRAGLLGPGDLTVSGALRLSLRNAEQALDVYMRAAESAGDEAMLVEAQRLSHGALARLSLVRSQLGDEA